MDFRIKVNDRYIGNVDKQPSDFVVKITDVINIENNEQIDQVQNNEIENGQNLYYKTTISSLAIHNRYFSINIRITRYMWCGYMKLTIYLIRASHR